MCTGGSQKCIDGSHGVKYSVKEGNNWFIYDNQDEWGVTKIDNENWKEREDVFSIFKNTNF